MKLRELELFGPIHQKVQIAQKTVKHTPVDKLYDAFISMLAGAHGLVEINTRLRSDRGLQAAFGRTACAEQSVVQETLDACTSENVGQMEQALDTIYRQQSQGYRHDYASDWQILDVNWLLERGYQVHCKDYSTSRAQRLAQSVQVWVDDPKVPGRQVGWVRLPASEYVRPVRRLAVRCRKANGQWGVGVLISTLDPADVLALTQPEALPHADPATVLLAYVSLYDQRGGGVETSFKGDKQGLGINKRNKKRFEAKPLVILLGSLAHNVVVWAQCWLTTPQASTSKLQHYGTLRMVRDVFHVSGFLVIDTLGHIVQIVLNQAAPLASLLADSLGRLLASEHVAINLGQT